MRTKDKDALKKLLAGIIIFKDRVHIEYGFKAGVRHMAIEVADVTNKNINLSEENLHLKLNNDKLQKTADFKTEMARQERNFENGK